MTRQYDNTIKQRTFIAASPEKVFAVITSAKEWDAFFTTGMQLEPKAGGVCNFAWKDWGPDSYTLTAPGSVLEVIQDRRFVFQWGKEGEETRITFDLAAEFGGTVLTLTEEVYMDTPNRRAMSLECATGWGEAATLMKFYIEHGITYTPPARPVHTREGS